MHKSISLFRLLILSLAVVEEVLPLILKPFSSYILQIGVLMATLKIIMLLEP
jgi:hypothetical protein